MTDPNRGLLLLILQFLDEHNLSETARSLEYETGVFFNMTYFEEMLNCCAYNEAENYLSGFTDVHDNPYSTQIYLGIRKLKFLEALQDGEREIARDVIESDIEVLRKYNEGLIDQAFEMLEMKDFMRHKLLSSYGTLKKARNVMMASINDSIHANPLLSAKLRFPPLQATLPQIYNMHNANETPAVRHSAHGDGEGNGAGDSLF